MSNISYRFSNPYVATATAILLNLPQIADSPMSHVEPSHHYEYESLAEIGEDVLRAFAPERFAPALTDQMFALVVETAKRLIADSKPLEIDFARVVEKEFWKLLQ